MFSDKRIRPGWVSFIKLIQSLNVHVADYIYIYLISFICPLLGGL